MIELGVNIDHVATVRQARRTYEPDPVWAAVEAHLGGADGITVHLREDRRHIQDEDVRRLRELTHIKLNLEMAATDEMVAIAQGIMPEMAMLVPEGRHEVTTEGGLDIVSQESRLREVVARLAGSGIITSVFIDAELRQVEAAARIGARVCEIHTGPYAHAFHSLGRDAESPAVLTELDKVRRAGEAIRELGMRFNAGHALNYFNVQPVAALPGVRELHIGHAIVSRAIYVGMREAVREMKRLMREGASTPMIYGIGTDVVLVRRIEGLLERYGERFARRVLGPGRAGRVPPAREPRRPRRRLRGALSGQALRGQGGVLQGAWPGAARADDAAVAAGAQRSGAASRWPCRARRSPTTCASAG